MRRSTVSQAAFRGLKSKSAENSRNISMELDEAFIISTCKDVEFFINILWKIENSKEKFP